MTKNRPATDDIASALAELSTAELSVFKQDFYRDALAWLRDGGVEMPEHVVVALAAADDAADTAAAGLRAEPVVEDQATRHRRDQRVAKFFLALASAFDEEQRSRVRALESIAVDLGEGAGQIVGDVAGYVEACRAELRAEAEAGSSGDALDG